MTLSIEFTYCTYYQTFRSKCPSAVSPHSTYKYLVQLPIQDLFRSKFYSLGSRYTCIPRKHL